MPVEPGQNLLHYRLIEQIGEGGMGVVWKALDPSLDREVAIKILPEAFAADPDRLGRFQREAKLLASMNHANIAAIYGLHEADTAAGHVRFLALELVPGEDLAQRLERGPLPVEDAIPIASQIAEALEAAHEQGVIHRDLKPANVVVGPDGGVKVLDFGLAKTLGEGVAGSGSSLSALPTMTSAGTRAGMILGTAAYMSPEQAKGKSLDRRTDLWSFGAMLFEMLTGRSPYAGESLSETLAEVLKGEPDWSKLPANTPPAMHRLLRRCLTRDTKWRLSDMGGARLELRAARDEEPTTAPVGADAAPRPGPSRLTWVLGVMALAAIGALSWFALWSPAIPAAPRVRFTIEHPDPSAVIRNVIVAPNGRFVAYRARHEGTNQLWVRELDAAEPKLLPGTEGAGRMFVSPDSRWIGFPTPDKVKKVAVTGGTPVDIADIGLANSPGATWAPDDTIWFSQNWTTVLSRMSADGESVEPMTVLDRDGGEVAHYWPAFVPGTDKVLYTVYTDAGTLNEGRINVLDQSTGKSTTVGAGIQPIHLSMPDGDYLFYYRAGVYEMAPFDSSRGVLSGPPTTVLDDLPALHPAGGGEQYIAIGPTGVMAYVARENSGANAKRKWYWMRRDGHLEQIELPPHVYFEPDLSPDGTQLAITGVVAGARDIFVHDLQSGATTRLTNGPINQRPRWSPDGTRIAFDTLRLGSYDVFWKEVGSAQAAEPLMTTKEDVYVGDFSPDGEQIIVMQASESGEPGRDLFYRDVQSGETRPVAPMPGDDSFPTLSPDNRWLAFSSTTTGSREVYVMARDAGGTPLKVSRNGGDEPRWAAGGSRLVFNDGREISVVDVDTAGGRFRVGRPEPFVTDGWSDALAARYTGQYTISPEGDRILVGLLDEPARARIEVVVRGAEELVESLGAK